MRIRPAFRSRPARILFTLAAFGLTLLILGYLIYNQRELLLTYPWNLRWEFLALAFILFSLGLALISRVWVQIIAYFGPRISFSQHFRAFCISNLAKRLPGTVWYVAWRAQSYGQHGLSAGLVSLASGVEMAVMAVACIVVSLLFAIPFLLSYSLGIWISAALMIIVLAFFHPRIFNALLHRINSDIQQMNYWRLLGWIGVYIIDRLVSGAMLFAIANFITPLPLSNMGLVIGSHALVGVISLAFFFSPSNFGISEISLSLLLSLIMPSSLAAIIAIVNRIVVIIFEITWALISVVLERFQPTT